MNKTSTQLANLFVQLMGMAALALLLVISNAWAQDVDNDGFTDTQEKTGIVLLDGTIFPMCQANALVTDPCVHPLTPDVFIILIPVTPGLIPANPLGIIPNLTPTFGVHQITAGQATQDRIVTSVSPQKAIRITESLDTNDTIWGRSLFQGTPNTAGDATVFTQRIKNAIVTAYQQAGVINAVQQQADTDNCVRHTIAHESGHNMLITSVYNSKYGGYHYSTSSQVVMSQTATIVTKGGKVTITCPQVYASPDSTSFKLK
jgi:hypothetical protein